MDERPLIRGAPVAARTSRFVDSEGLNAFRDIELDAAQAESSTSQSAGAETKALTKEPGDSPTSVEAIPYAGDRGGGVRPYGEGDFVTTQVAVSWSILAQSCVTLGAVVFGWLSYFVVWVELVDELWYWFVVGWFLVAHLVAFICLARALRDRKLVRIGVIAAEEKPAIRRALFVSTFAFSVTLGSLLLVLGAFVVG